MSAALPQDLRDLVESGPLTYVSTINADGSAHVTAIWIGLDGDDLISTHMRYNAKLRNMQRDPRVVLSFAPRQQPGDWMSPHAVIYATASVGPLVFTGPLLTRLAKAYVGPDAEYPDQSQTGYIVRYSIDRIGGVGPWVRGVNDGRSAMLEQAQSAPDSPDQ